MKSKMISKIIGPLSGVVGFMVVMGVVCAPVQASEANIQNEYKYNSVMLSNENTNNNVIEQNGVKVSVSNILGTKNEVKADIKIESNKSLKNLDDDGLSFNLSMDNEKDTSSEYGTDIIDDNTMIINASFENSQKSFLESGNLRLDLVIGELDFNGSLKIPVNFTEGFTKVIERDVNYKLEDSELTIDKFQSNVIGTKIFATSPHDKSSHYFSMAEENTAFLVKADGKIYNCRFEGTESSIDDLTEIKEFEYDDLKYDDLKDAKEISIIPVVNELSEDDRKSIEYSEDDDRVTDNNIRYKNKFEFDDKTTGEIKAEKTNDTIKFYCKGDSYEKSLLMACGIDGSFVDNSKEDRYLGEAKKVVYRDSKDENTVVAEFKNEYPNAVLETYMYEIIKYNDKISIGNEIKVK